MDSLGKDPQLLVLSAGYKDDQMEETGNGLQRENKETADTDLHLAVLAQGRKGQLAQHFAASYAAQTDIHFYIEQH